MIQFLFFLSLLITASSILSCTSDNTIKGNITLPSITPNPPVEETPPTWYHPQSINDYISVSGLDGAYYAKSAIDEQGNIIVVWIQRDGAGDYQVFKSEYRNGVWTHPSNLEDNISPDGQAAWHPRVAMNNNGNAIIVWHQSDGANSQIFKSEYRNGSWTHPSSLADNISLDGSSAQMPIVSMDNSDNIIITWEQSIWPNQQIFKSEYRLDSWTHPSMESDQINPVGHNAVSPRLSMNDNGTAVIVWSQSNGSHRQTFKSEYRLGSWTHPTDLNDNISPDGSDAYHPKVEVSLNEDILISWSQSNGSHSQIFKSEYRLGSWTHPIDLNDNISPDGQDAYANELVIDNDGNSVITWVQSDGTNEQVFMGEYRNNTWTHPTDLNDNISPNNTRVIYYPYVSMNKSGSKILIYWDQYGADYIRILRSEYTNGSWSHPSDVDADAISPDGSDAYIDLSLGAINNNGMAIILWWQQDGSAIDQIFMSHFR